MAKVTGIGGVFFKCSDVAASKAWYRDMLGVEFGDYGITLPFAHTGEDGYAVLSPFAQDTSYFEPGRHGIMVNLRVDDLDALQLHLAENGVEMLGRQDEDYGKFAWVLDPDGIKLELWQQLGPAPPA